MLVDIHISKIVAVVLKVVVAVAVMVAVVVTVAFVVAVDDECESTDCPVIIVFRSSVFNTVFGR